MAKVAIFFSLQSNSHWDHLKPISPSEILNKIASGADDCGNEYEELLPHYTNCIHSGKSNTSMFSACDVPLYQLYDFDRVS